MPAIWKLTFQEPDVSGLLDRLLMEAKNQESQKGQATPRHVAVKQLEEA